MQLPDRDICLVSFSTALFKNNRPEDACIADLLFSESRISINSFSCRVYSGAAVTVTNPGGFGSVIATPVINQPQVAILDLEAVVKRPVVVTDEDGNDSIAIRPMTYICMWLGPPGAGRRAGGAVSVVAQGRRVLGRCLRRAETVAETSREIRVANLGVVEYGDALSLQEAVRAARQADEVGDTLLLLEHPPVYTRGKRTEPGELPMGEDWYRAQGIDVVDAHEPVLALDPLQVRPVAEISEPHVTERLLAVEHAFPRGAAAWPSDRRPAAAA